MRIRTIKPEFWSHPVMSRLDSDVQLLAIALLSYADDHGYFRADAALVRGALFPFREDLASISRGLARLSEAGWIALWEHSEQGLMGVVVNWSKHQKIDHPTPSKLAGYDIREKLARDSRETRAGSGNREQGTGNREQGRASARADDAPSTLSSSAAAPADLPPRLRDAYREILDIDGAEVAGKALSAGRRLFRSPSPAQLLETWKCAASAGKLAEPADRWPDFRERMRADQRKDRSPCAVQADEDALEFARQMDEALLAGSRK